MKIGNDTINILKNFSTINSSISFNSGNVIRTISEQKNILAQAVTSESFPVSFGVYDLNQFLGVISLFEDGDLDFQENKVVISEGSSKCNYTYTDPSMITSPPKKNIEMPSPEVTFTLSSEDFRSVYNAANQLSLSEIVVRGDGNTIELVAKDTKDPSSNEYSRNVGVTDKTFSFVFKSENLKLISDSSYHVEISTSNIAHFKGKTVEYWIATEVGSKYEG